VPAVPAPAAFVGDVALAAARHFLFYFIFYFILFNFLGLSGIAGGLGLGV
jgi:hypothetical protein